MVFKHFTLDILLKTGILAVNLGNLKLKEPPFVTVPGFPV